MGGQRPILFVRIRPFSLLLALSGMQSHEKGGGVEHRGFRKGEEGIVERTVAINQCLSPPSWGVTRLTRPCVEVSGFLAIRLIKRKSLGLPA